MRMQATPIPGPDAPREEVLVRALEMISNTGPLDVTGDPACNVPAGLVDGRATGMMLVGKRFDDATVLRVADAFQQLVGGFPAPRRTGGDGRHDRVRLSRVPDSRTGSVGRPAARPGRTRCGGSPGGLGSRTSFCTTRGFSQWAASGVAALRVHETVVTRWTASGLTSG